MIPYSSKSGKRSGATAYYIGKDFIVVAFKNVFYKYSYDSCGKKATEKMKKLARQSQGLSTYISRNQPLHE